MLTQLSIFSSDHFTFHSFSSQLVHCRKWININWLQQKRLFVVFLAHVCGMQTYSMSWNLQSKKSGTLCLPSQVQKKDVISLLWLYIIVVTQFAFPQN